MKTAAFLLPLLLVVAAALARPAEPEVVAYAEGMALVEAQNQRLNEEAQTDVQSALVRDRRSPQQKERGTITGSVHREKGVGTVVQAQGQGNVWTSKKGNARVDAHGEWSKVVNGPGRGKPNYNVGIRFTGRF